MATLLVMRSLLAPRGPLDDAKHTLSSWDNCMAKNYCKWPVIAVIIIGGIIVLSVVLCIARCVCCGAELACCCFKCCSCCCPSGRSKHKRVKTPPPQPYNNSSYALPPAPPVPFNQQYRAPVAPTFTPAPASPTFNPAPAPSGFNPAFKPAPQPEAPQFARYDAHAKPVNEDSLPAMPSWSDAKEVHVEETVFPEKRDDVEMDRLNHNGSVTGTSMAAIAGGGAARMSPGPRRSPVQRIQTEQGYGHPPGYQNDAYANNSPHRSPQNGPGGYNGAYGQQMEGYRGASPVQRSLSPTYGAAAGYQNQFDRRPSPAPSAAPSVSVYSQSQANGYTPSPNYSDQSQPYFQQYAPPPLNTNTNYHHLEPVEASPVSPNNGAFQGLPSVLTAGAAPKRDPSPVYSPAGSTRVEAPLPSTSPAPAYPGQQTYGSAETSYPGQQPYRAFTPGPAQAQNQPYSGVPRKAVEGSWKEI